VKISRSFAFGLLALALTAETPAPAPAPAAAPAARDIHARLAGLQVVAHRGGYGFPDSNTVERFEQTRRLGIEVMETDLRVSSDGVVFLAHNTKLDNVSHCTGEFASHTAAELERCHLHDTKLGPSRFEDALRWSRGQVVIDAELKTLDAVRPAIDLVRKYDAFEWVYFQVGNGMRTYQAVRSYDQRVALEASPRGARGMHWLGKLLEQRDPRLVLIQLHPDFVSPEILRQVHVSGKLASMDAWQLQTEESGATCAKLFELGIDVAVTNAPELCTKQRDEARASRAVPRPATASR
jgi:glycerophosphoryl diester phosphodiesterase